MLGHGNSGRRRTNETDVSAFVDALSRHGFVLQGEPDLTNKMFVKMRFVKAASPSRGKGAVAPAAAAAPKKKFLGPADGGDASINEAAILKPCVYKLR